MKFAVIYTEIDDGRTIMYHFVVVVIIKTIYVVTYDVLIKGNSFSMSFVMQYTFRTYL